MNYLSQSNPAYLSLHIHTKQTVESWILPWRRICRIPPVQESSRIINALTVGKGLLYAWMQGVREATGASPTWVSNVVRQCLMSANTSISIETLAPVGMISRPRKQPPSTGVITQAGQIIHGTWTDINLGMPEGAAKGGLALFSLFSVFGTGFILKPNSNRKISPAASK